MHLAYYYMLLESVGVLTENAFANEAVASMHVSIR